MDTRIKQILEDVYPEEVGLLDNDVVDELIDSDGDAEHLDLEGDDKFDLAPVYELLKSVAQVVKKLVHDYDAWKIRHATTDFKLTIDANELVIKTADPATKAEIAAKLPELIESLTRRSKTLSAE